jgi:lysine 2,3-aminomutase
MISKETVETEMDSGEPPGSPLNWHNQLSNRITKTDVKNLRVPFAITKYYFDVISKSEALKKTMMPSEQECIEASEECEDPLSEERDTKTKCIVHRYPDRVLFLATDMCAAYCRYCTRSRLIEAESFSKNDWDKGLDYIREHKEIRDVIISGGDPFTMCDSKIEYLLSNLRAIDGIEIIRMGTKVPVVMPDRITQELVDMLKKYHPLYLSLHFTHPDELTEEVKKACNMLADGGIPLGSQTVLLKDVNDNAEVMKKLMQGLLKIRVKPYYIYFADLVSGTSHFRTSIKTGLDIIQKLRGWTSGYAIPQLIIDLPRGGGKIPLLPEYLVDKENGQLILKNYKGETFTYPEHN